MQIQNFPLTDLEQTLHQAAVAAARNFHDAQADLLKAIVAVDASRLYEKLQCRSCYSYCVEKLGLTEDVAYRFMAIARKGNEVPELFTAVNAGLPFSKARRIVPVISKENCHQWLHLAWTLSCRKLEQEVAKAHPQSAHPERIKPISSTLYKLEICLTHEHLLDLRRAQDLESSRTKKSATLEQTYAEALKHFLWHKDPLKKAARARQNLAKHKVTRRDQAQCQAIEDGEPCTQRRWLHTHHILPKSQGGTDDPENLITLCSYHHHMVHRALAAQNA